MTRRSANTIGEVGKFYMNGMSEQISLHFATTIDLRLGQVEAMVQTYEPGTASRQKLASDLIFSAQVRDFNCLGYYNGEGGFEMLYGGDIQMSWSSRIYLSPPELPASSNTARICSK